jgi:RNA polymerase sigma factor (TIGR02999 family)
MIEYNPSHVTDLPAKVYDELRVLARARLASERPGHTLQATALVHEAWLKLMHHPESAATSKAAFFAAAAQAMRQILVDHARGKSRIRRGGVRGGSGDEGRGHRRQALELGNIPASTRNTAGTPEEILALDEAICRLEQQEPLAARVVTVRFFAGLTVVESAEALGVSERTIKREWQFARAWLYRELGLGR